MWKDPARSIAVALTALTGVHIVWVVPREFTANRLRVFQASDVGANDVASARLMEAIETQIAIAGLSPSAGHS